MNWEALNEALIFRRKLELIIKYRVAVPGIMQVTRYHISCRALGTPQWWRLSKQFERVPTDVLIQMKDQLDNEIDFRLDRFYIPLPV